MLNCFLNPRMQTSLFNFYWIYNTKYLFYIGSTYWRMEINFVQVTKRQMLGLQYRNSRFPDLLRDVKSECQIIFGFEGDDCIFWSQIPHLHFFFLFRRQIFALNSSYSFHYFCLLAWLTFFFLFCWLFSFFVEFGYLLKISLTVHLKVGVP